MRSADASPRPSATFEGHLQAVAFRRGDPEEWCEWFEGEVIAEAKKALRAPDAQWERKRAGTARLA